MVRLAGIPLADLFGLTDRINSALPQSFQDIVDRFVIVRHRATRSPGAIVHHGELQSLAAAAGADVESVDLGFGTLRIPLATGGVPFQLSMVREPITDSLEPAAQAWQLDLALTDFILELRFLEAALYVPDSGTAARHLVRDPANKTVRIIGGATVRFEKAAADRPIAVKLVDASDPLDPMASSGPVASLAFSPPHFFFGTSAFGMTVGRLSYDFSADYSPPFVLERGQSAAWMGLAISEATIYAPRNLPGLGDLSGGVRDVLIGSPLGLQGELEIQFGRTALDPASFRFVQEGDSTERGASGSGTSRTVSIEAAQDESVRIDAAFTASAPPEGGSTLEDWGARWTWPDGSSGLGDASSGMVRHGQVLRVVPFERIEGQDDAIEHPEIKFRFVASGTGAAVRVTLGAAQLDNVVHLSGTAAAIGALTLSAVSTAPGTSQFSWEVPTTGQSADGASFTPAFDSGAGMHFIVLREHPESGDARLTRVQVRLVDSGRLLLGTEGGVFASDDAGTALEPSAVEATFDLADFHASGELNPTNEQAVLAPAVPARVTVPAGGLARVTIAEGGAPPVVEFDRHVQVLMKFDDNRVNGWGPLKPSGAVAAGSESDLHVQLLEWAAHYPGAEFLVIGRCDDIGSDAYNNTLADRRAAKAVELLTTASAGAGPAPVPAASVAERGEQDPFDPADGVTPADETSVGMSPEERAAARLINLVEDQTGWPAHEWDTAHAAEVTRRLYRRADVYAIGGAPTEAAIRRELEPGRAPNLRRSLIPATGRDVAPADARTPRCDYRVKLVLGWDKPTASGWRDAVPNLAEFELAWTPEQTPLPSLGGEPVDLSREVLMVYGKWIHDELTGFTRITLGVRSDGDPEGLFPIENRQLTTALAFGPMLLSGVDLDNDTIGSAARLTALGAAVGFAGVDLGGGPLVGDDSKAAVISLEAEAEARSIEDPAAAYKIKFLTEYTTTLHVNGGALGLRTDADQPLKLRYKDVGIEFDSAKSGWDQVGLAYATDSMEIENPGKWRIDGVLGELLRIVEVSMGNGSLWIEGRVAVAISIGVVEISEAILRLTFVDGQTLPRFELRGFAIKVSVPQTVHGEGRLRIEDGGVIKAGIDVSVLPLGLGASAAIAFGKPPEIAPDVFLNLFLRVQFATPLPLGQSGAAIYGFMGQFVMNGRRHVAPNPDIVGRELGWWRTNPEDKYAPASGQYALGVGVVVGTMPDVSFCFSASGMVVVAFPDVEVILGVDVKVIEVPDTTVTDEGGQSGTITGLVVIDDQAVTVAVSAQYQIPKILSLKVPFGAYFPYSLQGTYVRLGADGVTGTLPDGTPFSRAGEPITLTLLPGTLNLQAWAYLMIEQDGLPSLGGDARFSFDGFSVGFGAGAGLEWSAGPIKLRASCKLLVGFGTNPLLIKGGLFVDGELDLVVVSISARGEIILTYLDENLFLDGEFCGEVDLFLFSLEGCVSFKIGTEKALEVGEPAPPVASVALTDRRGAIMGEACPTSRPIAAKPIFRLVEHDGELVNEGAAPKDNHTVWPDTAPVITFRHFIEDALGADGQFDPTGHPVGTRWFGSNRLKYAYRLDDVRLKRKRDGAVVQPIDKPKLQSVWTTSPYRQPDGSGLEGSPLPSEAEAVALKLLDWEPWGWAVPIDDGGESTHGDPADTVEDVCEPLPEPRPACVFGRAARGIGIHRVRLDQATAQPPPYPSRFFVVGEAVIEIAEQRFTGSALSSYVAAEGATLVPGRVENLPAPVAVGGHSLERGYRLPALTRAVAGGVETVPLPWQARFDRQVTRPSVTLLVCDAPGGATRRDCFEFEGVPADGKHVQVTLEPFAIRALDDNQPFVLSDRIDSNATPARFGSDGRADVMVPLAGIELMLRKPCRQLELYFLRANDGVIAVTGLDSHGAEVGPIMADGPPNAPIRVVLTAPDGVLRVRIKSRDPSLWLYRVCCVTSGDATPGTPQKQCEDFRGLKPTTQAQRRVEHRGFSMTPLRSQDGLRLLDVVDQRGAEPVPGSDGGAEIHFPDAGMVVRLPRPCTSVEVYVMVFAGAVKVEGRDASGRGVAAAASPRQQGVAHRIVLDGRAPIVEIVLAGGSNEALLLRVCCADHAAPGHDGRDGDEQPSRGGDTDALPMVRGRLDGRPVDTWAGRVLGTRKTELGRSCRVVVYEPPRPRGPWDGFEIRTPEGLATTLLAVCAIDEEALDRRDADQHARDSVRAEITAAAGERPTARREIVLAPGEEYELEVAWSWQAWQSNADGTNKPPAVPPADAWTAAAQVQRFHFRVASEDASTGFTQDGLNEHVFDARDIARYLNRMEPEDGRAVHFLDDAIWAHFGTGHIEQLVGQYGRTLKIEVKRTDPPPQSSPAALAAALAPVAGVLGWRAGPSVLDVRAHQRINAAVAAAPCLPAGPVTGGASLGGYFQLEPLAMYDLELVAPRLDGSERAIVAGTRFITSRYANPAELVEALGFGIGAEAPFPPDEILLPDGATLPAGGLEVSDALLGDLLAAMDADTLPLPVATPRTYVVWRFDANSGEWTVAGLLIDSLEPLRREIAVERNGAAEIVTRFEIRSAHLAGTNFAVLRTTRNWTRVFLKPTAPVSLVPGRHALRVSFETSDGPLDASRSLAHVPRVLEQEGL